jgi:hypothetical protein
METDIQAVLTWASENVPVVLAATAALVGAVFAALKKWPLNKE